MDHRGQDLDTWEEVVEKADGIEAKANLQPSFYVREINSKCPKSHRPSAKKDKEDTYREPRDKTSNKDKNKAKSYNSSASTNQLQTQALKKNKRSCRGGYPAIEVNANKRVKKDKDKVPKYLSHVKCYTCKQKSHYINKCPEKSINK